MGRNGLLIDEMQNKVNTAKKCDPQSAFEMMLKADNLLTEINELMSNTGISGVSSIGYTSQSSKISRLQDNMEKLMDYPDMLIDNYFERFDGDFASGIQQSCEQLRNFYFDSIVYKNAASDELIERPLYQFSKIYARVNSAIDNIKEAPTGFLIVTARVNRNPAIKEKAEVKALIKITKLIHRSDTFVSPHGKHVKKTEELFFTTVSHISDPATDKEIF